MTSNERAPLGPRNVGIVVSCGRTGTQFIAEYFAKNYRHVAALHEPPPSYELRRATHAYMAGRRSEEEMARLLRRKRRKLMQSIAAGTYIESNGYLHGFIPVLDRVWHDPHVIHIVRDPRTFIPSAMAHQNPFKRLVSRVIPDWLPDAPALLNIAPPSSGEGWYAAFWRAVNESIERKSAERERYHVLQFEEMFDATHAGLRRLCEILSLEYREAGAIVRPDQRINASRSNGSPHWREWPPALCAEVDRICGAAMHRYGYGTEEEWLERVRSAK